MKTKFGKLIELHRGLITSISEITTLHRDTISKARDNNNLNFDTKHQIYNALITLKIINPEEITLPELFEEVGNEETPMNSQEDI